MNMHIYGERERDGTFPVCAVIEYQAVITYMKSHRGYYSRNHLTKMFPREEGVFSCMTCFHNEG
jgi:hypothetical protein